MLRRSSPRMPDFVIASVPYQEKAVIEILKSGARFLGPGAEDAWRISIPISRPSRVQSVRRSGERA